MAAASFFSGSEHLWLALAMGTSRRQTSLSPPGEPSPSRPKSCPAHLGVLDPWLTTGHLPGSVAVVVSSGCLRSVFIFWRKVLRSSRRSFSSFFKRCFLVFCSFSALISWRASSAPVRTYVSARSPNVVQQLSSCRRALFLRSCVPTLVSVAFSLTIGWTSSGNEAGGGHTLAHRMDASATSPLSTRDVSCSSLCSPFLKACFRISAKIRHFLASTADNRSNLSYAVASASMAMKYLENLASSQQLKELFAWNLLTSKVANNMTVFTADFDCTTDARAIYPNVAKMAFHWPLFDEWKVWPNDQSATAVMSPR